MRHAQPGEVAFDEWHLLGARPWFWALQALMVLSLLVGQPAPEPGPPRWVQALMFLALGGTLGYRVRIGAKGVRVTGAGFVALFWVVYPFLTRKLQGPVGEVERIQLTPITGIRRHFGWPMLWFGKLQTMSFGAPFRLDVVRRDGGTARLYVRDGRAAAAAARAAGFHVVQHADPMGAGAPAAGPDGEP